MGQAPNIGRFISEDPIRDDLNWYVYCGSNPLNFWDPLGLADTLLRFAIENLGGEVIYHGDSNYVEVNHNGVTMYYPCQKTINGRMVIDDEKLARDFGIDIGDLRNISGQEITDIPDVDSLGIYVSMNIAALSEDDKYANIEIGRSVYVSGNTYTIGGIALGNEFSVSPDSANDPDWGERYTFVHIHVGEFLDDYGFNMYELFSGFGEDQYGRPAGDAWMANIYPGGSFLVTPNGKIKKMSHGSFNASEIMHSSGSSYIAEPSEYITVYN